MAQRSKVANVKVLKYGTHFLHTNKQKFYAKLPGKTTCQIRREYKAKLYINYTHTHTVRLAQYPRRAQTSSTLRGKPEITHTYNSVGAFINDIFFSLFGKNVHFIFFLVAAASTKCV
jgi:hypothetical protein